MECIMKTQGGTRTQRDKILCYLCTGKPLTPLMALRRFGCLRLGARIWELRASGHRIQSELVKRGAAHVAQYRLDGQRH
jgi:hypothetical protein